MKNKAVTKLLDISQVILMLITMSTMLTGMMVEFQGMFGMVFILVLTLHVISKWSWIKVWRSDSKQISVQSKSNCMYDDCLVRGSYTGYYR